MEFNRGTANNSYHTSLQAWPKSVIIMAIDSSKSTKGKTKTKACNQRMGEKYVVLNKLYIDYKAKTVPCSLKFKTDRMTDIIELHKVKFNAKYREQEGMKVQWDDDLKQNGY